MLCFLFLWLAISKTIVHSGRIANKCMTIIETLPSLPVRPDDSALSWLIPHKEDDIKDFEWILSLCTQRFSFLEAQHRANKLAASPKSNLQIPAIPSKSRLFILDLDETIVYQRTELLFQNAEDINTLYSKLGDYNEESLVFSMQQRGTHEASLNIYRPKLMEFISKYHNEYDFVLYTAATVNIAVFHVVAIEMYYNYWHCTDRRRQGMFYFKNAVFRMPGIETKSIGVLAKMMHLKDYDKAMIIDDNLHSEFDEYKVWELTHNETLYLSGYQIRKWHLGIDEEEREIVIESYEKSRSLCEHMITKISCLNDTELLKVGKFLSDYDTDLYTPRTGCTPSCTNPILCGLDDLGRETACQIM